MSFLFACNICGLTTEAMDTSTPDGWLYVVTFYEGSPSPGRKHLCKGCLLLIETERRRRGG